MKLILFGSVQGVGKTTLLSWLEDEFTGQIVVLNPGELFRRYFYDEKLKTIEEIEELIASKLEEMPDSAVAVLHWHYAVRRPEGYIPQIAFSRLERLAKSGKIEQVVLLMVEAPIDVVLERRAADRKSKKRALSRSVIREEVAADEEFLMKHQTLFAEVLGDRNVVVFRLPNVDLEATKRLLGSFFTSLLNKDERR